MNDYKFELTTGCMGSGKTEELMRRLRRAMIAGKKVLIFKPEIDTRSGDKVVSRNQLSLEAKSFKTVYDMSMMIPDKFSGIVAIDEIQFCDKDIIPFITMILYGKTFKEDHNIKIIAAGLDTDFRGQPFGYMPQLMCLADSVTKLTAICMKCGSSFGVRTQKLVDDKVASKDSPLISIGGDDKYEARCLNCFISI